jgi:G3E family GTPase
MEQSAVKIDIIAGFLGAGKTTLINKLLNEAYKGERVALLENEFGEIGIDGDLLQGSGIAVKELSNGCICCTLQTDFIEGIQELVETWKPERILIEPTGIAQIADVLSPCGKAAVSLPLKINSVITVVNAASYPALSSVSGEFFTNQISNAWFIALSAVQDISNDEISLAEMVRSIRDLNPTAPIITDPWDAIDGLTLLTAAEEAAAKQGNHDRRHEHTHEHEHHHHHNHHHEDDAGGFSSASFRIKSPWTAERVRGLADILKGGDSGEVFRAKGLLPAAEKAGTNALKFDYVYGTATLSDIDYPGEGKLVVIGRALKTDRLERYLSL